MKSVFTFLGSILLIAGIIVSSGSALAQTTETQSTTGTYTLSTSASSVTPGQTIRVTWAAPQGANITQDWVGIFPANNPSAYYITYAYINNYTGSVDLQAPSTPGNYEIRYGKNNRFNFVATQPLTVTSTGGGTGSYTLTVSPTSVAPGGTIQVSWTSPQGANITQDWVGIFPANNSNARYISYAYITAANGSVSLQAPSTPGTYEVRYGKNNRYTFVATQQFTVTSTGGGTGSYTLTSSAGTSVERGQAIQVNWTAPQGANISQDWVGIFPTNNSSARYISYAYITGYTGSVTLRAPTQPGSYEIRYGKNNRYNFVAKTQAFQVTAGNTGGQERIIAFGDSLVAGVGSSAGGGFVPTLSELIDQPIENAGISGNTTMQALARLESDVLSKNPTIVIVLLGGNDVLQRVPSATTLSNIRTIVTRIQERNADVVLVGIHGTIYNAQYQAIAQETGAFYVPEVLSGILGRSDLTVDFIHPNDAGYAVVAQRMYAVLQAQVL